MTITFESVLNDLKSGRIPTGIHSSSRKSWFKYCYHFSHVENIVSILSDGRLLSRNLALKEGKMIMRAKKLLIRPIRISRIMFVYTSDRNPRHNFTMKDLKQKNS